MVQNNSFNYIKLYILAQRFRVRPGYLRLGRVYETNLMTLYAIRGASSKTQDVWIACNMAQFGSFDDIVIATQDKDSGKQTVFLVQCTFSHNAKPIHAKEFSVKEKKGFYNMERHRDDFITITTNFNSDTPFESIYNNIQGCELWCILFTNRVLNENWQSTLEESSCDFINTVGHVFKFKLESVKEINLNHDNNEINEKFLNHFLLFSSQIHNREMHSFISNELLKLLHPITISPQALYDLVNDFNSFIMEWWSKGQLGGNYFLTKTHTIVKLTELLLERYMSQFYTSELIIANSKRGNNFEEWHSLVKHKNIIEFFISDEENDGGVHLLHSYFNWLLREYNVYQKDYPTNDWENRPTNDWEKKFSSIGKEEFLKAVEAPIRDEMHRTLGSDPDITLYRVYKVLWKVKKIPVLLVVNTREDYEAVLNILSLSDYTLKCIILNKSNCQVLPRFKISDTFSNLVDLEKNAYELVLEKTVELQGRPIQLKHLFKSQSCLVKIIGAKEVMQILTGNFKIGNAINKLPIYHVVRTIPKITLDLQQLLEALEYTNDLFIIQCSDRSSFFEVLNDLNIHSDKCAVVDYENVKYMSQIPDKYKIIIKLYSSTLLDKTIIGRNVHHLELHNTYTLEWVATKGSIKNIYSLKHTLPYTCTNTPPINAHDALGHFQNQINIISAVPGMGKSVIMNYIAQTTPTDMWILLVNLNQHLDYYGSEQFKSAAADPVKHLNYFNQVAVDNKQMNSLVRTAAFTAFLDLKAVLILLDGFDEVPQYYRENITDMTKSLLAKGYRIWLTTRPNLQSFLEKEFDTFAIDLNPFSCADQLSFLIQYFSHVTVTETEVKEITQEFAKQLLQLAQQNLDDWKQEFTAVPLHIRLLVECFEDDYRNYLKTKRLTKNFNLLYLYEKFTLKKIAIAQEKYGPYGDKILFDEYHQLFSLQVLFSFEDLEELQIDSELARFKNMESEAVEILSKSGIIVKNELSLHFSHRSFAEYFAAKWLSRNFKNSNVRELIKKTFQSQYSVTRKIFDQLLAKDCPLHLAVISQQMDEALAITEQKPELLITRDAGGRLPIHLAAAWGTRHPMPGWGEMIDPNIHKREDSNSNINVFLKKICIDVKEFIVDDVLELTPLNYAIISDSLSNLDAILSTITFSTPFSIGKKSNVKTYIYYCSRYGYEFLLKRILGAYSFNQLHFYINYPLDKTFKRTAVHWASTMGHKNIMNLLLFPTAANDITQKQERDALCKTDVSEQTALHLAVENKHAAMVVLLLSRGANLKAKNRQGRTPLHVAAHNGDIDILNLLFDGSDINSKDANGNTELHLAALQGYQNIVFTLLQRDKKVNLKNNNGETSLHLATKKEHVDVMRTLLKHNSKIIDECDNNYNTALHVAAEYGHFRAVELLLSLGADQNAKNDENKVALHLAAAYGHKNIVALLIPKTDINIRDYKGNTPLHLAALDNHQSTASELVDRNANIDAQNDLERTALHVSALKNSKAVASFLLENGINYNQRDESKRTALHLAAMCNSSDIVELLLYRNMNPNDKDIDGNTSLHLAVLEKQLQTISILLSESNKIKINEINSDGRTPLHLAAQIGNSVVVELLLSHAAHTEITDKNGNSAVDLANINHFSDVSDLFDSIETDMFI